MFGTQNNIPCAISCIRKNIGGTNPTTAAMTATLTSSTVVQMKNVPVASSTAGTWLMSFLLMYSV
jgi:hypothetical protein